MRYDFSSLDAKRLAALFPIILVDHDPAWETRYSREKQFLVSIFGDTISRISHIGSTAVPGLLAKPTIDILLELSHDIDLKAITEQLKQAGYAVNTPDRDVIMYLKGYTPQGFQGQAYHIHVRLSGDWDELYFTDYLKNHEQIAEAYAELKMRLQQRFSHDRDGYTEAKGDFIRFYTQQARSEMGNRYDPNSSNPIKHGVC